MSEPCEGCKHLGERVAALEAICAGIDKRMDDRFAGSDRHFDRRLQDQHNASEIARTTAVDAINQARDAREKGEARTNEWRAAVNDIMDAKMDKSEVIARLDALNVVLSQARGDSRATIAIIVAILSIIISPIVAHLLR